MDINDIIPKKQDRELPKHINMNNARFEVSLNYNSKKYRCLTKTLEAAISKLDIFQKEIADIKEQERIDHFNKPILRNSKNQAILIIKNKKREIIDEVPVSDDRWHELTQYSWSKTDDYYQAYIDGKMILLHRYLMNAKPGQIVDHINNDNNTVLNNTNANLRINDFSGNNHNKIKSQNKSSQYIGVSYKRYRNKWEANIKKDGESYYLGQYSNEKDAAIAYNKKATELYKDFANLNII
jgi:hypothetical protein